MRTEGVTFYSEGVRLRGFLHLPETAAGALPFIVQGPGWLGLADAKLYQPYHGWTPYAGQQVRGVPMYAFLRGEASYDDGARNVRDGFGRQALRDNTATK